MTNPDYLRAQSLDDLKAQRVTLLRQLNETKDGGDRVTLQAEITAVNAAIKAVNISDAMRVKAAGDAKRRAGRAQSEADLARAIATENAAGVPLRPDLAHQDQVVGVGVQGVGDQLLADLGAVGIGGVDEVDIEVEEVAQHRLGLGLVVGHPPYPRPRDAHGAEAESVDGQIAAEGKRSGRLGNFLCAHFYDRTLTTARLETLAL